MTLQEIIASLDQLTPDEISELKRHIQNRTSITHPPQELSPAERIRLLREAREELLDGLTPEQVDEMIAAINEKHIETWNEPE